MMQQFDSQENYQKTRQQVGYQELNDSPSSLYEKLGFMCGLEIHQQLATDQKLFCRCPTGLYQDGDDFDAEIIRHMRPTLSELGEYDGTALMEFKTKKNITYRIKNESACTYDIDDTPPFPINKQALAIAVEIALLLKTNIVGELHITRKQYLDGSIPTGFQRTAIVGIEGEIPLGAKKIKIIQLSIEEDSCREVSDIGHERIYTTDRLGIPLIETVTYPDMKTPHEAAKAGQYLRFLTRSSGKVRTGIGAARQDVNVSITGGTRVEIKGVAHISWIPRLTHNEAFRQKALLAIRDELRERVTDPASWKLSFKDINSDLFQSLYPPIRRAHSLKQRVVAINLPQFRSILSFFTQPEKVFADELSDRLKVIACLEKPNMLYSEQLEPVLSPDDFGSLSRELHAKDNDAQIIIWGNTNDIDTAIDTIDERCRLAFDCVPNETRKSFPDGTTIFERVLPGPDRMYPDTDSAPIPIDDDIIEKAGNELPPSIEERLQQLKEWRVPEDTHHFILHHNLVPLIEKVTMKLGYQPRFVGNLLGHSLRYLEGRLLPAPDFGYNKIYGLLKFVKRAGLEREIVPAMLKVLYSHPKMEFDSILTTIGFERRSEDEIIPHIVTLRAKFKEIRKSKNPDAETRWIMGKLRELALGNIPMKKLCSLVEEGGNNG